MNEEIWGDPQAFRPERFLDANMKIINDDKLFAFGAGMSTNTPSQFREAFQYCGSIFFDTVLISRSTEMHGLHDGQSGLALIFH